MLAAGNHRTVVEYDEGDEELIYDDDHHYIQHCLAVTRVMYLCDIVVKY